MNRKQTTTVDNNNTDLAYFNSLNSVDAAYLASTYLPEINNGQIVNNQQTTNNKKPFSETTFGKGLASLWGALLNNQDRISSALGTPQVIQGRIVNERDFQAELEAARRQRTNTFVIIGVAVVAVGLLGYILLGNRK